MKNILLIIALVMFTFSRAEAQGENLFKAKCNTCHLVNKNATGPWLKGVKQKWTDAGESAQLYQWVKNSDVLIKSGNSKLAIAIQNFSASVMPPQQVTETEVDQILDYIDNWTPPVATTTAGEVPLENVKIVPNYKSNLTVFYVLIALLLFLLIVIVIMGNSILNFIKSDTFIAKIQEKNKLDGPASRSKLILLFIIGWSLFDPISTHAMSIEPTTPEPQPYLLIEDAHIYALLAINLLLVFVVLYLKRLFNSFFYMVYEKKVKPKRIKKVSKVLTDAVPIEEEASILMDHEYDGIQELDNNLPPWWKYGFYITILVAIIYIFNYHILKTGDSQLESYRKEIATAQKDVDDYLKSMAMNVDETNATLLSDAGDIDKGKVVFTNNCTVCHKSGEGDIGPNLTDKFWLYGNDIKDLFKTIKNGTPNGMPDHASKLNPIQIQQVASYVLSLPYKVGKEPQGNEIK